MKKFLLSSFVIISFIFYAFQQRTKTESVSVVVPDSPSPALPTQTAVTPPASGLGYKDGVYTGSAADAYYGNVQVKVTISAGKINNVQFLDYPHDRRTSQMINSQAMPDLKMEVIQAQNANVDIVSGATATSQAFMESLKSALTQAQI